MLPVPTVQMVHAEPDISVGCPGDRPERVGRRVQDFLTDRAIGPGDPAIGADGPDVMDIGPPNVIERRLPYRIEVEARGHTIEGEDRTADGGAEIAHRGKLRRIERDRPRGGARDWGPDEEIPGRPIPDVELS